MLTYIYENGFFKMITVMGKIQYTIILYTKEP